MKLNSAVAIAMCVDKPAKADKAGISRIPPTPTVPMSIPTMAAVSKSRNIYPPLLEEMSNKRSIELYGGNIVILLIKILE